ncbi:hypothetical protein EHS25_001144 [Saitozyma podzolica]|uniref:Uncharacterized protein n=1 Tax=Saitozyma podzolica TaxID=1890683 RepID=A0A427YHB0_9TREE|nr:hypothetical protein EHS25_001144 [Saitozyma podzolica]
MLGDFRVGLAAGGSHASLAKRAEEERALAERATCNLANGDLYIFPNASSTVDATKQVTFTWNTACAMSSSVDLYLYESSGLIHAWTQQDFSAGSYTATLLPSWWNDTTSASLQLSIINHGQPSWMTSSPAGPVFTVDYAASAMYTTTTKNGAVQTVTASAAATQSSDAVFQNVSSTKSSGGISKGAIAAAVIVPLLALAAIAAVAVRFWRQREAEKRRRWSQALSTHSNLEWEKGALPGDKPQSILGRPSMSSYMGGGGNRAHSLATSSIYAVENNMAGAGAGGLVRPTFTNVRSQSADNLSPGAGMRSSLALPDGQVRQSRISFADAQRPDRRSRLSFGGDLRPAVQPERSSLFKLVGGSKSATELATPNRSRLSSAYASGSAIADDDEDDINISPSQMQGPGSFADAEMRRIGGNKNRTGRKSILSLGGGRRESVASHLSADDFKSAASARGSVDELRDLEAVMLMRRSVLSQNSASRSSPNLNAADSPAIPQGQWSHPNTPVIDTDQAEDLDMADDEHADEYASPRTRSPMPTLDLPVAPSPIAGSSTVAYGPDQMLAVYAARGKVSGATTPATSVPTVGKKQGIRILTNFGGKKDDSTNVPAPSPVAQSAAPGEMRSYVHLNRGTVSSAVVDALPPPGPPGAGSPTLRVPPPSGRARSNTVNRQSEASFGSTYSDNNVGHAQ